MKYLSKRAAQSGTTGRSQPEMSLKVLNRAIYDQAPEFARDFRVGFDKGGTTRISLASSCSIIAAPLPLRRGWSDVVFAAFGVALNT
jgi:hypothetical protein